MLRARFCFVALALSLPAFAAMGPTPRLAEAAGPVQRTVPGEGTARPRAVYTPGTEAHLAARLEREPYRRIFLEAHARHEARRLGRTPGDPDKEAQKDMTRAARWFAFEYAIDRTVVDGQIVPFADAAARDERGAIVEELLLGAYDRSRLAVPPPLGGWDRDIDTAGEIVQWTGAFDTMLGAGYDFGDNEQVIADRLIRLTSELYRNYTDLTTASGFTSLHQNNHRSKSGVAMATAAVVLADHVDADDPDPSHDPMAWWDQGVTEVDEVLRHVLITGDGAYAEGSHYYRFTTESVAPYVGMWERLLGDASWTTAQGRVVPAMHHTPQFALTQDWMLAMTLPDGTLAPVDDANTQGSQHFGALPPLPNSDAYAWRWATAATPYAQEGTIDLAVDSIVAYDDARIPTPPAMTTSFWPEGGQAVFRSDWTDDATLVIAQGEGPTASEFGRDSTGAGRSPQSHEHIEPGSFLLHAHGEALVLDPGYLSFGAHGDLLAASDHSTVLVNGAGPRDALTSSFAWADDLFGPPPQDGLASITETLDTKRLDAATVTARYGALESGTDITLTRRFLFVDDRYLVIADEITPETPDGSVELDFLLQGNGGGTSGGTFASTADGGRWTRTGARVESALVTDATDPSFHTVLEEHESPTRRGQALTHEALHGSVTASGPVRAIQVVMPSSTADAPPTMTTARSDGRIEVGVDDAALGRQVAVVWDAEGLSLVDRGAAGDVVAWSNTSGLDVDDVALSAPGASAVGASSLGDGALEVIAVDPAHGVYVSPLGTAPVSADGACGLSVRPRDGSVVVAPSAADSFVLRSAPGGTAPGAVGGVAHRRAEVGATVHFDGRRSCDLDGDPLTPRWELVSAPRGSDWVLGGADTWEPSLLVDAAGTFRIRLTVTDAGGAASSPVELVVAGGPRCADERDDDLDGRFDGADPDCDGPEPDRPVDATGFYLPDASYLNVVFDEVDTALVNRDHAGVPIRIRTNMADGSKRFAINVRRVGQTSTYRGTVRVVDFDAGVFRTGRWRGTITEPTPGTIVGRDDPLNLLWFVVDRSVIGN